MALTRRYRRKETQVFANHLICENLRWMYGKMRVALISPEDLFLLFYG